jgi:hypothetical protein
MSATCCVDIQPLAARLALQVVALVAQLITGAADAGKSYARTVVEVGVFRYAPSPVHTSRTKLYVGLVPEVTVCKT